MNVGAYIMYVCILKPVVLLELFHIQGSFKFNLTVNLFIGLFNL